MFFLHIRNLKEVVWISMGAFYGYSAMVAIKANNPDAPLLI